MDDRRKQFRYRIRGAWVAWEKRTFWRGLRSRPLPREAHRHELLDIGVEGLAFSTVYPPRNGRRVSVSVILPGRSAPFTMDGTVAGAILRKKDRTFRVRVTYPRCPEQLVIALRQLKDTAV